MDRTMNEQEMQKLATKIVGDGKRPNKYFVSVSSDYSYLHDEGQNGMMIDYIGDIYPEWENKFSKGNMVGVFSSFQDALDCANEHYIGQKYNGYTINRITIEDRISGEVYEKELVLNIQTGKTFEDERYDINFTKQKLGENFK